MFIYYMYLNICKVPFQNFIGVFSISQGRLTGFWCEFLDGEWLTDWLKSCLYRKGSFIDKHPGWVLLVIGAWQKPNRNSFRRWSTTWIQFCLVYTGHNVPWQRPSLLRFETLEFISQYLSKQFWLVLSDDWFLLLTNKLMRQTMTQKIIQLMIYDL